MKRILYLTFFFKPDLSACSFRNSPLFEELARQAKDDGIAVDLFTTLPQRYSTFTQKAEELEEYGNVRIERIPTSRHKSGFRDQIISYRAFFREVKRRTKGRRYDLVFVSTGRLFSSYLGYSIAHKQKIPLYLDVRDIFVDTINDVVKNPLVKLLVLPVIKRVERTAFGYARHINLISEGFKPYFSEYGKANYTYFTNGIDEIFIESSKKAAGEKAPGGLKRIVYAGNFGEGQGLHKIIPQAAALLGPGYEFHVIGDGGAKQPLLDKMKELGVANVVIKDPVNREKLITEYHDADYLFLHLNDYDAFKKVLPSKIFELGVFDKPLIAGVGGYAAEFLRKNLPGTILFSPGDAAGMVRGMKAAESSRAVPDREAFIESYRRDRINSRMAESMLQYVK